MNDHGTWPRTWPGILSLITGSLAVYVVAAGVAGAATGSAMIGAAVSNLAVLVWLLLAVRPRTRGPWEPSMAAPASRTGTFAALSLTGLGLAFVAGQTAAVVVYDAVGSPGFDLHAQTNASVPLGWLLVVVLALAPLGEESLLRGIAYPALRAKWPPLAAAFVTSMVFALLHGNLVQIAVALPLGLLMAAVYEVTGRLTLCVVGHMLFNAASVLVPAQAVAAIASPAVALCSTLAFALVLGRMHAMAPDSSGGPSTP